MAQTTRLLPVDLAEERERQLEALSIIYVCAEGRPHQLRGGKMEGLADTKGLTLRRASKARRRRGFWGAYGDVPLIIAREVQGGYSLREHPEHPFEYFEILGRWVKRLYGHTGPLPWEIDNYAAMTEPTLLPAPKTIDLQAEATHAPV